MRNIDVSAREILDAASAVLAATPRATLEEIARAAGLSRATLHRAFSSREALLRAIALDALSSVEDGMRTVPLGRGDALEVLHEVIEVLVPRGAKFHFLASEGWLERDEEFAARIARLEGAVGDELDRAREEGLLDGGLPREWQLRAFFALVYAGWEAVGAEDLVPRDAVRAVFSSFLEGQRARADRAAPGRSAGRRRR